MSTARTAAPLLAVVLMLAAAPAFGQSAAEKYGPKEFSRSELIEFGTFARSPLELPWTVDRTEQVPEGNHINFAHVLGADFETVRTHFKEAYIQQTTALKFKKSATPTGAPRGLKVLGRTEAQGAHRYTLGNKKLRRQFTVVLERRDDETVLTFENITLTLVFGGGVPRRAPFQPIDADPIPFGD